MEGLRYHELAEANHRIMNPFTEEQLMLLGEICGLQPGIRQLDLACGKGEMLSRWAKAHGITGVGVDISAVFLEAARQRAAELGVSSKIEFVREDAAKYSAEPHAFDVVSCIGATWIGGGLAGTLEIMKKALKDDDDALLLVGEPFWWEEPSEEALEAEGAQREDFAVGLDGILARFEASDVHLLEMVIAAADGWDRYSAKHWMTLDRWLRENPDDVDAEEVRQKLMDERRGYLRHTRRSFGWGVFVLRAED